MLSFWNTVAYNRLIRKQDIGQLRPFMKGDYIMNSIERFYATVERKPVDRPGMLDG